MSQQKQRRSRHATLNLRAATAGAARRNELRATVHRLLMPSVVSVASILAAPPAVAQTSATADTPLQEVVVTGVRHSEQASVEIKRNAESIEDSISAEDIGRLPDATISDSLQRITGVQIERSGGEGSRVNIRGLPQVGSFLNGEGFLTATTIDSVQPDYTDIPSQLFAGADVIKTPTADILNSGITGTINLRTRRPSDLESGFTAVGSVDGTHGSAFNKWEPEANGLIGYNAGRWGALVSVAYSDVTVSNTHDGMDQFGGKFYGENASSATSSDGFLGSFGGAPIPSAIHQLGGGNVDVNGNGTSGEAFYGSDNFTYFERQLERKRLGVNGSVQGDLGHGLTVVGDWFYTDQHEFNRLNGWALNSSTFLGGSFVPVVSSDKGVKVGVPYNGVGAPAQELYTTQVYTKYLGDLETNSEDDVTDSISRNYNLQLNYDNGGNFTGNLRGIYAKARQELVQSYVQFSDADGSQWPNDPFNAAPPGTFIYPADLGGNRVFSPNGFAPNTVPVTVDMRGDHIVATLPSNLQNFLANEKNYALKTISSEGNYDRSAAMKVLRADGHYKFDDSGVKLDFGMRRGTRDSDNVSFNYVAPVYAGNGASDPAGCLVRWKAADVVLDGGGIANSCTAGNSQGYYRAGVLSAQNPSQLPATLSNAIHQYNIGGVSIYNLDPAAMDNPLGFQNSLYPGERRNVDPSQTWRVEVDQTSGYLKGDFAGTAYWPFSGNVGVRLIKTDLHVTQHAVGNSLPYGLLAVDNGTVLTDRAFTDVLPALNFALDFTDKLKLRLAYSKNMQLLNLDQWGGGLALNYAIDTSTPGSTLFRVLGGNSSGNPKLDPWRSSNYDASLEYYVNRSTLVNVAIFYIDVASFINQGSVQRCDLPDQDGVVRNHCVSITGPIQGNGATLRGGEFGIKQAFDFLPSFWRYFGADLNFTYSPSNTGVDLAGHKIPFQDNSAEQANAILWYQNSKVQVRLAGNYRSKRAALQNYGGVAGLEQYQAPTFYLDASGSYDFTPHIEMYVQASNITNQRERYYLVWPDQVSGTTQFETRVTVGIRGRF